MFNSLSEDDQSDDTHSKADYLKHSLLIVLRFIQQLIFHSFKFDICSDWFKNEFFKWRDGHFTRHNDPRILLGKTKVTFKSLFGNLKISYQIRARVDAESGQMPSGQFYAPLIFTSVSAITSLPIMFGWKVKECAIYC